MFGRRKDDRGDREHESTEDRADRYVLEGRLVVTFVERAVIRAVCQGDRHLYELGHDPERGWWCACSAKSPCAHLLAVRMVTDPRVGRGAPEATEAAPAERPTPS